jgi:hypothetical protein
LKRFRRAVFVRHFRRRWKKKELPWPPQSLSFRRNLCQRLNIIGAMVPGQSEWYRAGDGYLARSGFVLMRYWRSTLREIPATLVNRRSRSSGPDIYFKFNLYRKGGKLCFITRDPPKSNYSKRLTNHSPLMPGIWMMQLFDYVSALKELENQSYLIRNDIQVEGYRLNLLISNPSTIALLSVGRIRSAGSLSPTDSKECE